jgi:hypothetical protein
MAKKYIITKSPFKEGKHAAITIKVLRENPAYEKCEVIEMGTKKELQKKGWLIF